jgi:hypothetical protein
MKSQLNLFIKLSFICVLLFAKLPVAASAHNQGDSDTVYTAILVNAASKNKEVEFGIAEIHLASREKGRQILDKKNVQKITQKTITVEILSDSAQLATFLKKTTETPPKYAGWQCYSIRSERDGTNLKITILSKDGSGAMYGCLDIAEAIRNGTIGALPDSDNKPYLERRGIKFNVPLDLRTPSYSDFSDAYQQNIPVMWEMDFWKQQLDEMARNRYNTLSLWSLNPFPSMVKVPEYPDVALDDVWRTTYPIGDKYGFTGNKGMPAELLSNYEVVKKMTINEKITFWRKVMEYANDRGIEVFLFNWNIFTLGEMGKYGITPERDNDTTIAYFRASVREMILTYPHLSGFGITAGENMPENKAQKYTKEQWLWKTYGEGIRDALRKQPDRKIRLIHRFHQTGLEEINKEFREFPTKLDLSIKYSVAHMYSIPDPPFAKGVFDILPQNQRLWLTVRNDDIYSFRWGNPTYARQYLQAIPHPEKVAGYYMGSDGYCWGRDFLGRDDMQPRPLIIQKNWYSFMLWGRLSYNPELPDELFHRTLDTRFPGVSADILMKAWSAASMIFPWITRLSWGDIDVRWFPEACLSHPSYKGFYTVKDFMEVDPMPGSNIMNIAEWAQNFKLNSPDSRMSPLTVADTISKYVKLASIFLQQLPAQKPGSPDELTQTLGDIEAFAAIGNYYQEKIRGACSLALFNFYGLQQDKEDAIHHLTMAKTHWTRYAEMYDAKYKPANYNRVGYVNIPALIEKTEKDIQMAKDWKVGAIKEYKTRPITEKTFRK